MDGPRPGGVLGVPYVEPGQPDVINQMPAGGKVSTPSSGVYGEKAALARLESALPLESAAEQTGASAPLPPMGQAPPLPPPSAGLPRGLFGPTRQPSVPASTPLTEAPPPPSTPTDQVIRTMELLAEDRNRTVSRTTRQWAQTFLESLRR